MPVLFVFQKLTRTIPVSVCCYLSVIGLIACQAPEAVQPLSPSPATAHSINGVLPNLPRLTPAEAAQEKSELEIKIQAFLSNPAAGNLSLGKPLDTVSEKQRQEAVSQAVMQRRQNSAAISLTGAVLMPSELPHADLVNAVINQGELPKAVPLANHGVIARGPDGNTLALTTTKDHLDKCS